MGMFENRSLVGSGSLKQLLLFVLFLLSGLMLLVGCHEDQKEEAVSSIYNEDDLRYEDSLKRYLRNTYPSVINKVSVTESFIEIMGNCVGEGHFYLGEIPPYLDVTKLDRTPYKVELTEASFSIVLDRFIEREGVLYDRLLSKWAIFQMADLTDQLVSHARHADEIWAYQHLSPITLTSKKGLGGLTANSFISDLSLLGISSATINVCITHFMHLPPKAGDIEHLYGGKTYYMDEEYLNNTLDKVLLEATKKRNISVAAIILIDPASRSVDTGIGELLQHPDYSEGTYTMPNMTTLESVNCYAAALDFLAKRYCRSDNCYGRISHWIMHNEVDGGLSWTNMGVKSVTIFSDTYIKSMRMCYNIVHQYDQNSEVFISFSHGWNIAAGGGWYKVRDMLDFMNLFSKAEGDFFWSLACHSYPAQLGNPCTWDDAQATFSMDTEYVTLKNLEVLDKWVSIPQNQYKGGIRRSVWLSEAGTCSPSYADKDLQNQAAGFAFGWKKINALEGINGIQWHSWFDHLGDGARLGLRKYNDEEYQGEAKPVWMTYQKAGTDTENEYFEQYLQRIGIDSWEGIIQKIP